MQHFTYTFLLVIAVLAHTSCVSDSSSDSTKAPETPPKVVKKDTPKPPAEPPAIVEKPSIKEPVPPSAPPKKVTPPPAPKKTPPPPPPVVQKPVVKSIQPTPVAQPVKKYTPPPPPPMPVKSSGKLSFANPTLNYGYIEQGDVINHKFKYTNTGSVPVNILRADASCGCTRPTYSFMAINPGETGEIGVRFDSKGKLGKMESKVTVLTDAKPAEHVLYLVGTITDPPKKEEDKKEATKKKGDKSKDSEEKDVKSKDKTEKENPEPEVNKDNSKKGLKERLPFKGRKLPKGTPPGERENKDTENDESGRN